MRLRLLPLIVPMLFALHLNAQAAGCAKDTLWLVPHTHWEGAVFKTREEYLEIGLPNIVRALTLLKAHPEYRFVLDQVCYVKPFLGAISGRGGRVPKVCLRRKAAARRWHRHDARQQHARW
jgi:hypothetical protein